MINVSTIDNFCIHKMMKVFVQEIKKKINNGSVLWDWGVVQGSW